ncbi:MAG: alpha/beta hydrolase [Gemmataceae bacterium]|nr:alpha/beta hydrolase [Gemmataceae bacterium]MDW8265168.1 alpha/beta hydrolase [Gemmataceae bacterium]
MRRTLCLALLAAATPTAALGQTAKKEPPPMLTTAAVQSREAVFKRTPQGDLVMHLYLPPDWKASDRRPAIIFFFGGGWSGGSHVQFIPQARYLASRGLVAACADYRIASKHKTTPDVCVEDAKSAIRWLRGKAPELGIDPDKVIASGGSAGGHLAAATALVPGFDAATDDRKISCKPNALVLFNPALNLEGRSMKGADGSDVAKAISPTLFLDQTLPPTIIFFGTADRLLPQGEEFLTKAKTLGRRVELWTAADMPHSFFNRSPWLEVTTRKMDEFLAGLGYLSGSPTVALPAGAGELKKVD